jgi:hypothetical protein
MSQYPRWAELLSKFLIKVLKSPNFLSGMIFGFSGIAFAAANIILAGVQTVEEYAIFSLVIAVLTLFSGIGLFGADGIVNRHTVAPDARMFGRVISTGLLAAVAAAALLSANYGVGAQIASLVVLAILAQTTIYFVSAYFQSRHDFRLSLFTFNSSNYVLLAVALVARFSVWENAVVPLAVTTALLVLIAMFCVVQVTGKYRDVRTDYRYSWREAMAYISITGSAAVMIQLERLLTPELLDLKDLATLGVVLAIVAPPFRLLQISLGYVLLPKLRATRSSARIKSMIKREIGLALALLVPSWILVWYLVPLADAYFFGDKYPLSGELIFSAIFAGTAKALSGIARASVAALVSARQLEVMGVVGWIGVAVSIAAASYGAAAFGLTGIVYGVSAGWIIRLIVSVVLVRRCLVDAPQVASAES